MRALFAAILLLPSPAFGAPLFECASLSDVRQLLSYCSDNVDAVNSALECYDKIGEAWESTGAELRQTLLGVQARDHTRQQGELGFTESDYNTSVRKMNGLIETSEYNLSRVHTYSTVMLDYVGGGTPETSAKCYLENVDRLRAVENDIRRLIKEGTATRDQAMSLGGAAGGFKTGLADVTGNGPSGGALVRKAGENSNGASDVTGIAQDRAKSRSLASFGAPVALRKPALRPEDDPSFVPVTGELPPEAPGKTSRAQILASYGGPQLGDSEPLGSDSRERIESNESAQRNAGSVGALLFAHSEERGGALVVAAGSGADGRPERAFNTGGVATEGRGNGISASSSSSLSEPAQYADAPPSNGRTESAASPLVLVGTEESLFTSVHNRYRESELFRKARVSSVPLEAFGKDTQRVTGH
jgi:hypothetical protein